MKIKWILCLIIAFASAAASYAQPTDAQLRKQLTNPKTVSITFGRPGKSEWSKTYSKFMWTRYATVKLKTDEPGIVLVWYGYVAYDIIGRRFNFWRTFTTSNTYEGIPNLTDADLPKLVEIFGYKELLSNYYFNRVVGGKIESFKLAPEPKFEWSNPNTVEFNTVMIYIDDNGARKARVQNTVRIRLLRENAKSQWFRAINMRNDVNEL